jgi:Holliday junction resolvase-like predicted endonuclease
MANLEINVPDDLHERLCRVAGADGGAVGESALAVIRREVERLELTMAEWQARRKDRPTLHIDFDAAAAIREERQRREQEWDRYIEFQQKNTS